MSDKFIPSSLTPEQIKNWRQVLLGMIGPWALMMSDKDVQKFYEMMQAKVQKSI